MPSTTRFCNTSVEQNSRANTAHLSTQLQDAVFTSANPRIGFRSPGFEAVNGPSTGCPRRPRVVLQTAFLTRLNFPSPFSCHEMQVHPLPPTHVPRVSRFIFAHLHLLQDSMACHGYRGSDTIGSRPPLDDGAMICFALELPSQHCCGCPSRQVLFSLGNLSANPARWGVEVI